MTINEDMTLAKRFDVLEDTLNSELVERRTEVRGAVTSLAAGTHVFLLGPPGCAKSLLLDRLTKYISDTRSFKILVNKFTTPEEMFGPISLKGLENDEFVRKLDGYLAACEIALLDEIFKASSSILNTLLWAINEREYRHGNQILRIPLRTMFCASNELPQSDDLAALYDRLLLRYEVKPIRDTASFLRMLKTPRVEYPETILTWDEVLIAQQEAAQVTIPSSVYDAMVELRRQLRAEGIEPTDRRFVESLKLVRASAWLDECPEADVEHLRIMQHVMWDTPEQQPTVNKIVLAIANPLDNEAHALLSEIEKLEENLDAIVKDEEKHRKGAQIHGKLRRAKTELDSIESRAGTGKRRTETITEVRERLHHVTRRVLEEVYDFSGNELPGGGGGGF